MTYRVFLALFWLSLTAVPFVLAWSNGGYSSNPSSPDFGTHDWVAEHALDWLPDQEKQYVVGNLAAYLYGTELPDNGGAPDGIGDTTLHHIYFNSAEVMTDDAAAVRASTEYNNTLNSLKAKDYPKAAKNAGVMSHYINDMAVFGHVMGSGTDWGPEIHHSDYEDYVNTQTPMYYSSKFNPYLSFDGSLTAISADDAATGLAYDTTFDVDGDLTCVWMDQNYNFSNQTFLDRVGESLNLAVNYIADVLHTLYLEACPETATIDVPRDYTTVQQAINAADPGSKIHVAYGIYDPFTLNKSLAIEGESVDNTIIEGKGTGTVILITANYASIRDFRIQNGNIGIEISDSKSNVVSFNVVINNDRGIVLSNCTGNILDRNTIRDNNYGIALEDSDGNRILRNTASMNHYGIDLRYSGNNTIECNKLTLNGNDGLHLYNCRQNVVKRNLMESNGQNGIYLKYSYDNALSQNNFINNTNQLYQYDSSNTWFSEVARWKDNTTVKVLEGNYWSDYAGVDTNGDSVGETLLPHQGVDNYPLLIPWSQYPVARFTCDPLIQVVNKTVTFDSSASSDEDGFIVDFTWDFGDGNVTNLKNKLITHHYTTFGDYTVTLAVTDNDALTDFSTSSVRIYTTPTARFTYYPQSPTVGESVTLNASLSSPNGGTIIDYSWDFESDGVTDANGMIVNHTYSSYGTYSVTLNVTNNGGLADSSTVDLTTYTNPTAAFAYYPDSPTVGQTVTFNASLSAPNGGTIVSYAWDFETDGVADEYGVIVDHTYSSCGTYRATLTVSNNGGLTGFSAVDLSVYTIPTAKFSCYPESPVVGQAVTFNASLSTPNGGTVLSYSWDFESDGVIDADGVVTNHTYSSSGTYNVTLAVTNAGGLTHAIATSLTVAAKPASELFGWLQSPVGITVLVGGTAFAIGVPVAIVTIKRRKPPSPVAAPPKMPPPPGAPLATTPPIMHRLERGPKAVITVSKSNGEYTVMVEGPETYPIKLKHQLKVDDKMKLSLVRDFDTTALIANYWHLSRSGRQVDTLPEVPTTDIITHLERTGRLMYKYMTPPNIAGFFKTARIDHLWLEIDESLLEIPWELMHDGDDFICLKYAVGRRILTAQIYEARPPKVIEKPHFLLIGDPSDELPDAKREIQLLKKHLEKLPNVEVSDFSGSEVTKLDFLQMISEGKYDCLHYAGHAGFNVERPDESYLKFSDGLCYAFEAKRLIDEENPPEIVFVNACSSAKEQGQTTFEKEIGGLARAFLFKGSMGYIGALWPIHDEAVAQLSVSFYTKLISGLSIGEALRQARRESFLKHKGKEIAWASFTLYGDPNLKLL